MRNKLIRVMTLALALSLISPVSAFAQDTNNTGNDLQAVDQEEFDTVIEEILQLKEKYPNYTDNMILQIMDSRHLETQRGITDIWNALTDSEKKLCIQYPFDALKVNTAKNIANTQTENKFGTNGLGDRSDAFRHGIWNAEMTVLIEKSKAELFATAHEDKDVSGNESDGYPKTAHRDMDLHNNAVGREIGGNNIGATEEKMADIIYGEVNSQETQFIWLHE